jgi:anthranilate phosphoribosyltransferase
VIEALGIEATLAPQTAARVLRQAGMVFLFAPNYHPAMRHVGPVRRELGVATIMNLLGPLANPAGVTRQVIGVADGERGPLVAQALTRLGAAHALVLHALVGMDEISPSGRTRVWEVRGGSVEGWEIDPAEYGLHCDDILSLAGGEPLENAERLERLLDGHSEEAVRCAVLLNAAAALYVSGNGWSFKEAAERAVAALEGGAGAEALARMRAVAPREMAVRATPS